MNIPIRDQIIQRTKEQEVNLGRQISSARMQVPCGTPKMWRCKDAERNKQLPRIA